MNFNINIFCMTRLSFANIRFAHYFLRLWKNFLLTTTWWYLLLVVFCYQVAILPSRSWKNYFGYICNKLRIFFWWIMYKIKDQLKIKTNFLAYSRKHFFLKFLIYKELISAAKHNCSRQNFWNQVFKALIWTNFPIILYFEKCHYSTFGYILIQLFLINF